MSVTLHQIGVFALAFGGASVGIIGLGAICGAKLHFNVVTTLVISAFAFGAAVVWG